MKYVITLADTEALDASVVGHKFRSLAVAHQAGLDVPQAVCLPTALHEALRGEGWPEGALEQVQAAARGLDIMYGISIRSSGRREDLEGASFAGQYRTFIDVRSLHELREKVEACFSSADEAPVQAYQELKGMDAEPPLVAVILQRMVHPFWAGVAFSRNPLAPARDEVVVEAVEGVGERLVSGRATPHRAYVYRDGDIKIQAGKSNSEPPTRRQWRRIAELTRRTEEIFGAPVDIEWAIDPKSTLWLLQARPITAVDEELFAAPAGCWTRRIADDLWGDRLTPFLARTMVRNASRFDLSEISGFLNIPVVRPTMAVISSHLYVNCASLAGVVTMLPRKLRTADIRALFPPGYDLDDIPAPNWRRLGAFMLRLVALLVLKVRSNPLLCRWLARRRIRELRKEAEAIRSMSAATPCQAHARVEAWVELLARAQENNQWPYMYAAIFTLSLRHLVCDVRGLPHDVFLAMISGGKGNVTSRIAAEFSEMAAAIRADADLAERFVKADAKDLQTTLPKRLQTRLDEFLARYGVRSRQRTLYVPRWMEAPQEVLEMLQGMVASQSRQGAERSLPKAPALDRVLFFPLAALARRYLDLREDLRFFLDEILFGLRRSLLVLGDLKGLGPEAMFLRPRELAALAAGDLDENEAASLAKRRHEQFRTAVSPADFVIDGRLIAQSAIDGELVAGVGTSAGTATGRARVIEDPHSARMDPGDIIVARATDPGWTPILSQAGGIVVEEGGLLNHCSIVARELGIPAVVGVRQATARIAEGETVTVDGGQGVIHLSSAENQTRSEQ
jgi:pyruvate,water dikinase